MIPSKQNYIAPRVFSDLPRFVSGGEEHFVHALRAALARADRANLLAAFVQMSGVDALSDDLKDAVRRGAHIRVLTGDYLGITNADGLRALLCLAEEHDNFEAALFETKGAGSFHPKSYMFHRDGSGIAYVGSSNLSRTALRHGHEWNLRLVDDDTNTLARIERSFDKLWDSPRAHPLSPEFIREYERRAPVPEPPRTETRAPLPEAHAVQAGSKATPDRVRERPLRLHRYRRVPPRGGQDLQDNHQPLPTPLPSGANRDA